MHSSKPSDRTQSHFSGPPAVPITWQPRILAIWPATDPVAPAAPETTTVSPACGFPMSSNPKYAVRPVVPKTPMASTGSAPGGTCRMPSGPRASATVYSCHPVMPETSAPTGSWSVFDSITSPTPIARITSPIRTAGR